jgi:hypothetical protein
LQNNAGFYNITVQASDKGSKVVKSTSQPYVIEVYDVNNFWPVFVHPDPSNAVVFIPEVSVVFVYICVL